VPEAPPGPFTPSQVTDSQDVAIDAFVPKCEHPEERENGGTDDLA